MVETYQPATVESVEQERQYLDPKTELGKKIFARLAEEMGYQPGDEIEASDIEEDDQVTPELLNRILVEELEGAKLEDIIDLQAEGEGNPLWDGTNALANKMERVVQRVNTNHATRSPRRMEAGNLSSLGAHGVYFPSLRKAALDTQMMIDSKEDYIVGVADHELNHRKTHDIAEEVGAVVIREDGQEITITETELNEAIVEAESVSRHGEKDVYTNHRNKVRSIFGIEGEKTLRRLYMDGEVKKFREGVGDVINDQGSELGVSEERDGMGRTEVDGEGNIRLDFEPSMTVGAPNTEYRENPVVHKVDIGEREYVIASDKPAPDIVGDLESQYSAYLSERDIEVLREIEDTIYRSVERASYSIDREVILPPELEIKRERINSKIFAVEQCKDTGGEGREFEDLLEYQGTENRNAYMGFREGVGAWLSVHRPERAHQYIHNVSLN